MCSSSDQPESYCVDCSGSMCAFCTRSHRRQIFTAKHEIESLDLQPIYCSTHSDERVSLYCDNCETLACRDCAISVHRGHSCNFIADVESEFRSEFAETIDQSEQKMMSLNGEWMELCLALHWCLFEVHLTLTDPFDHQSGRFDINL